MADFTPIQTQEEFNAAIAPRLERERERGREEVRKQYADYETLKTDRDTYRKQAEESAAVIESQKKTFEESEAALKAQILEMDAKIKGYEADSVKTEKALEYGLPYDLHDRLKGSTVEEIEADAKAMAELLRNQHGAPPPMASHDTGGADQKTSAMRNLVQNLTSKNGG